MWVIHSLRSKFGSKEEVSGEGVCVLVEVGIFAPSRFYSMSVPVTIETRKIKEGVHT